MSPAPVAGVPSGRTVRRWTELRRSTASTTVADTLADIYMGVLAAAMALASALYAARDTGFVAAGADAGAGRIDAAWLWLLTLAAALVGVVRAARRLGPVGLDAARVRWWLPLPVDRAGLIGPAAWRWPLLGAAVGGALGALAATALGGAGAGAGPVAAAAALGASVTGAACLALVPAQARAGSGPHGGRRPGRAIDLTTGAASGLLVLAALTVLVLAPAAPALPAAAPLLAVTGVALAGLVVAALTARRALPAVPDAELARGGGVAGAAAGAVATLDSRTLGALASREGPVLVRRHALPRLLARVPRRWRPPAALMAAEALVTLRRPGLALRPLLAVLALALVADVRGAPAWLLPVAVGIGGYVSACAAATGAKVARTNEGLDAHLPMGGRAHRVTRLAWAWAAQAPYVAGAALVLAHHAPASGDQAGQGLVVTGLAWVPILAAGAVGWAGASLRWAYRKDDEGTGPVAPSPMGPVPVGSIMLLLTGPDLGVVASVAVGLAVWSGAPLGLLLPVAAGISLAVAAAVTTPPPPYEE